MIIAVFDSGQLEFQFNFINGSGLKPEQIIEALHQYLNQMAQVNHETKKNN